jgi:hypothetical protein
VDGDKFLKFAGLIRRAGFGSFARSPRLPVRTAFLLLAVSDLPSVA